MNPVLTCLLVMALYLPATGRAAEVTRRLVGHFTEVPSNPKWAGAQLTFTGLDTGNPVVVWPDGVGSRTSKAFSSESLLVLQAISPFGSTETIYLELKGKRFLVIAVGALAAVDPNNELTVTTYRGRLK